MGKKLFFTFLWLPLRVCGGTNLCYVIKSIYDSKQRTRYIFICSIQIQDNRITDNFILKSHQSVRELIEIFWQVYRTPENNTRNNCHISPYYFQALLNYDTCTAEVPLLKNLDKIQMLHFLKWVSLNKITEKMTELHKFLKKTELC